MLRNALSLAVLTLALAAPSVVRADDTGSTVEVTQPGPKKQKNQPGPKEKKQPKQPTCHSNIRCQKDCLLW